MTSPVTIPSELVAYLSDFTASINSTLRRYRHTMTGDWRAIASTNSSMVLYVAPDGIHGRIVPRWLDLWVRVRQLPTITRVPPTVFEVPVYAGERAHVQLMVNKTSTSTTIYTALGFTGSRDPRRPMLELRHDQGEETILALAPVIEVGPTDQISIPPPEQTTTRHHVTTSGRQALSTRTAPIPWVVSILSPRHDPQCMSGLDRDPLIAAHGIVDTILNDTDILHGTYSRLQAALQALTDALHAPSRENEALLQTVVTQYQEILVYNLDYQHFHPEPTITVAEQLDGGMTQNRPYRPDFIYELQEPTLRIFEIEAATKGLFRQSMQTGYRLQDAKANAAIEQIRRYKHVFDGYGHRALRATFDVSDSWSAEYFLVIGRTPNDDEDNRSFEMLRQVLRGGGITIRTWDYYLSRLERRLRASTFDRRSTTQ